MKSLNDFKAFALGKAQMNAVSGGKVYCHIHSGDMDIPVTEVAPGIDATEASSILMETYPWADSVSCIGEAS